MKTMMTVLLAAALSLPMLAGAEGLQFKRSNDNGYDDYTGQITVSGKYSRHFDDEVMGDSVRFDVNGPTAKLIPRKKGDERNTWFCFRNQQTAVNTFKIAKKPGNRHCGYEGTATVTIKQYSVYTEISDGADLAQLISAKNVSAPKNTQCYSEG